jgi:hypothetical protein
VVAGARAIRSCPSMQANRTEHKQPTAVRITFQLLLHQQRQTIEVLAYVGMAGRKPHMRGRGNGHCQPALSAETTADTIVVSAAPLIRIQAPVSRSTSIYPCAGIAAALPGSAVMATAAKPGLNAALPHSCWRLARMNL